MSKTTSQICELIETFKAEDEKFQGGNASAGTRARKALMDIKKLCDTRRKEIQETKNAA